MMPYGDGLAGRREGQSDTAAPLGGGLRSKASYDSAGCSGEGATNHDGRNGDGWDFMTLSFRLRVLRTWIAKFAVIGAVAYAVVVALMFAGQTWLIFPTYHVPPFDAALPINAARLEIATPDGERLHGLHIPAARAAPGEKVVVLGFGGNAWNADSEAVFLHELFPDAEVVVFFYRGYRPSTGQPSTAALLADAPLLYDQVITTVGPARVVAVGFSIGSGVAAYLASQRPLAGLILVTPFDSLEAVARAHYPWMPVGWLLRHRLSSVEFVRMLDIPVAMVAAARDTVVPPAHTNELRRHIAHLILDRTISGTGHNDIYPHPDFRQAMAEALARIRAQQAPKAR